MNYNRQLEDKTRLTINGKRYRVGNPNHPHYELYKKHGRVGNPNHPHYELYKKHGIDAVLEVMGLVEVKQQDTFPWGSIFFLAALAGLIVFTTMGS